MVRFNFGSDDTNPASTPVSIVLDANASPISLEQVSNMVSEPGFSLPKDPVFSKEAKTDSLVVPSSETVGNCADLMFPPIQEKKYFFFEETSAVTPVVEVEKSEESFSLSGDLSLPKIEVPVKKEEPSLTISLDSPVASVTEIPHVSIPVKTEVNPVVNVLEKSVASVPVLNISNVAESMGAVDPLQHLVFLKQEIADFKKMKLKEVAIFDMNIVKLESEIVAEKAKKEAIFSSLHMKNQEFLKMLDDIRVLAMDLVA